MRALLLAAGLGTRLDPLTRYLPKCLMPLHGRPLLDHWLEKLSRIGVNEFVINTHHHAELVADYVRASRFSDAVTLAHEPELLGTSETIRRHAEFLSVGDSLVLHADNFCEDDLSNLLVHHRSRPAKCLLTILAFDTGAPETCGILEVNMEQVLQVLHHKVPDPPGRIANAATYVFTPAAVQEILDDTVACDFSAETLQRFTGRAYVVKTQHPFFDIGSFPSFLKASLQPRYR